MTSAEEEIINPKELLALFLGKLWLIILLTLAALVGSTLFVWFLPNTYQATARLLIQIPTSEVYLNVQEYKNLMVLPQGTGEFYNTQVELIKGEMTLQKVVEAIGISNIKIGPLVLNAARDQMVQQLKDILKVKRIGGTQLVEVSIILNDPKLASRIVNTTAEMYLEEYKNQKLAMTKDLADKITSGQYAGDKSEALSQIEKMMGVDQKSEIGRLKEKRLEYRDRLEELSIYYKEEHPEVLAIQKKISQIDESIKRETAQAVEKWREALSGKFLVENVRIVEYAQVPIIPIGPKRLKAVLFATFLGFAGSCGLVYLLYQWDPRIKREEDLMKDTGIVCLGTLPVMRNGTGLEYFLKLPSGIQDIVAYIRTAILFSLPREKSKVLVLTSAMRQEGRTSLAIDLACSFAADGFKTVLLDADIREARIHDVFEIPQAPGLTNFLKGAADLEKIFGYSREMQNLTIVPAGEVVSMPSELLSTDKMKNLLAVLKDRFDKIVVDTPPVLNIPDGVILSSMADGVILVVDAPKTDKRVIRKITDQFQHMNERIVGAILNRYAANKFAPDPSFPAS